MVGLLLSVTENEINSVKLDDKNVLQSMYDLMSCELVDVVRNVKIGNKRYDIVVDDEGLYKDNNKPSARCSDADQVLYGDIIVINVDEEKGEWVSLDEDDIENIQSHIYTLRHNDTHTISPILEYSYGDGEEDETFNTTRVA